MDDDDKQTLTARAVTISKAEGAVTVVIPNAYKPEDDYFEFYKRDGFNGLIEPPYNLRKLEALVQENNTLGPCVAAMVTNIDGTGAEIQRKDEKAMRDADWSIVKKAQDLFDECYPGMSFKTLRKKLRRDLETVGMAYIEVMRDGLGEIVFLGHMEAKMMRIGRLGKAVATPVTIERGSGPVTITQMKRERRFAQLVGNTLVWFAEFGSFRQLNKFTGMWAEAGAVLPMEIRASEVLYFGVDPDPNSPYHVPRWIAQTPSVIGSRKAEEHNLDFFDSGGIPPYLVIVSGGQLAQDTVATVREALNKKDSHSRVQVIEAFSTSGSLDGSAAVQVKVERFGAEKSNDPMFKEYDADCETRVRKAFRLPPIMIGKSEDYSYASAQASYLVAEAQVFKPERESFDEVITSTVLMQVLESRDYLFRSKPISIIDAETQLSVINAASATGRVDPENVVTLLGEIGGFKFQVVDVSTVPQAPNFGLDPTGKVVSIEAAKALAKSEEVTYTNLSSVLGCALAVLAAQTEVPDAA